MFEDTRSHWYNYDTGEYDYIDAPFDSVEVALPYMHGHTNPAVRPLFKLLVENMGMSIPEAFIDVMERVAGIKGE